MFLYILLFYLYSIISCSHQSSSENIQRIFNEYFQWKLESYPEWATKIGFNEENWRSEDFSLRSIQWRERACERFLKLSRAETTEDEELRTYQALMEVCTFRFFSLITA